MTFENFVAVIKNESNGTIEIETLGGRKRLTVTIETDVPTCINSVGNKYEISKPVFESVLKRFQELKSDGDHLRAKCYTDPKWKACPNRISSPYIASAIATLSVKHFPAF